MGKLPTATSPIQPVFVISAIVVEKDYLYSLTHNFLDLKRQFFKKKYNGLNIFQIMQNVVKGSEVRKWLRSSSRNERRMGLNFINEIFNILECYEVKIFGRVYIKGVNAPINSISVYTFSVQDIFKCFQKLLKEDNDEGVVIIDSRKKHENVNVSHSIFTQKYKFGGDPYKRINEMPVFGHDENHVGLQLVDYLCSSVLFPMAVRTYCSGYINNVHVNEHYQKLKEMYSERLKNIQYRYFENGRYRCGITLTDGLGQRSGGLLFRP